MFVEAPTGKCLSKKTKESNFPFPFLQCSPLENYTALVSSKVLNYVAFWTFSRSLKEKAQLNHERHGED